MSTNYIASTESMEAVGTIRRTRRGGKGGRGWGSPSYTEFAGDTIFVAEPLSNEKQEKNDYIDIRYMPPKVSLTGIRGVGQALANGEGMGVLGIGDSAGEGRGIGVKGVGSHAPGVLGESTDGVGVHGRSSENDGVVGESNVGGKSGVFGFNSRHGIGVTGRSQRGVAVLGIAEANDGVVGQANIPGCSGVVGENTANPRSITKRRGRPGSSQVAGVTGRANSRWGIGVVGQSKSGTGLSGTGGFYGAIVEGGRAPLRLIPAKRLGSPTTGLHLVGELYVDSGGNLFYCKEAGKPGTWVKLA
jgi:hypothetical protein